MEEVQKIYQQVFKVAKFFLGQSRYYTVQELAEHNEPTYDEVADLANQLANVLAQLAGTGGWDEERVALNARQAALYMHEMAKCISKNDEKGLKETSDKLETLTFI